MKLLTKQEEYELIKNAQNKKDLVAKELAFEKLIECNQGLVRDIASKFLTKELTLDELICYGNEGLLIAIKKFDFSKKTRLSTYAYQWIYQALQRGTGLNPLIHKPLHLQTKRQQMINKERELMDKDKYHRQPSIEQLSKALGGAANGFSLKEIVTLKQLNDVGLRLDYVVDNNSNGKVDFSYFIADKNANPEKYTFKDIITGQIIAELEKDLNPIELKVILMSFGLHPYHYSYKQAEIAKILKISLDKVKHSKYYGIKKLQDNKQLAALQALIADLD